MAQSKLKTIKSIGKQIGKDLKRVGKTAKKISTRTNSLVKGTTKKGKKAAKAVDSLMYKLWK